MSEIRQRNFPVAIVGMHGRFPGAYDVKGFWNNLVEGNNTIGLVPKERWDWEKLFGSSANESDNTTVNCAAFMPLVDRFDPRYFGIMPREAESMDPQQRLFMQTAIAALEDAGYAPGSLADSNTGVFVGIGNADYPGMMRREGAPFDIYRATGLALTCIPNRVSFSLNIHGPSEAIDTACSGSLVAIHRAIQSMQFGECDLAIAGGVNLLAGPDLFIAFDKAGMLSKSARCHTFDAQANGYVRGEGVAAVVLRPLAEAEKNGDYIYAVIHGSATNHGGRAHSFTAPNAAAQAQVVRAAWLNSGKNFHDAFMIETHGTGTPLGDPIEVNGLKKVSQEFGFDKQETPYIALGALKSHVGHMEAAAGIGGVIKAVLSMKYRTVPRNLNFNTLNPHIDLDNTPYYIPADNVEIPSQQQHDSRKLLAGVSSFGFGGVNAHIVLESHEADATVPGTAQQNIPYLIPLSGKDKTSLLARVRQLVEFLQVSCGKTDLPSGQAILDSLCNSLGISISHAESAPWTLASVNVTPARWMRALKDLQSLAGRKIEYAEVQDCISLLEAAQKIARSLQIEHLVQGASLCARAALPETEIKDAGLDRIAYSLMHGRDNFRERLACIAHSKEELLDALQAYIAEPEVSHPLLWTHSVKMNEAAPDAPAMLQGNADIETLSIWAAWWVRAKSGSLDWDVLYPQAAKPRKFPLPAYPFQLDRIWYKTAAQLQTADQSSPPQAVLKSSKPMAAPALPNNVRELLSLPSNIIEAWQGSMQYSQLEVPSSVLGMAYLLDYGFYKNQGPVVLQDMVFGRPCDAKDKELVFGHSAETSFIQCLKSGDAQKVIVQALLGPGSSSMMANKPQITGAEVVSTEQFIAQLEERGLSLGNVVHCIRSVRAADHELVMELDLPPWQAKSGPFWVPLIASMLSGLAYMQPEKALRLPWKIQSAVFNPESLQPVVLHLAYDTETVSALLMDESANPILKLEGMMMRETSAVKSRIQPEAKAA